MYQELARDVKDNHQSMEGMKEDMAKNKKDTAEALLLAQKALLLQAVTDLQLAEVDFNFNRFAGKARAPSPIRDFSPAHEPLQPCA